MANKEQKQSKTGKFISGVGIINPELVTVENDYSLSAAIALDDLIVDMHIMVAKEINRQIKSYEIKNKKHWLGKPIIKRLSLDICVNSEMPPHYGICVDVKAEGSDKQYVTFILNIDKLNRDDLDYLLTLALNALKTKILKRANI